MGAVAELMGTPAYKEIEKDIDAFVKEKLDGYKPDRAGKKVIHDSVWGSTEYSEWEMQLIDSPLLQRLRDINQVGLAFFTYPSARHSRFEHSLGVLAAAKKMCERICHNSSSFKFEDSKKHSVYLAALLHDVGHCFFSHLSERIYGEFDEFIKLTDEFNSKLFRKPKAHEILSFIIVNTESFRHFFSSHISYPGGSTAKLFHDVGRMIIGAYIEDDNKIHSYLTAIINGPFDVDRLDYIRRDSLTAGLSLAYDIERLFTKIIIHDMPVNNKIEYRLAIRFNGITAIEELTFCRIMLYSYIYYHQKVLTCDAMVKDYVYGLYKLGIIKTFADFLRHTDSTILNLGKRQNGRYPFSGYPMLDLDALAKRISHRGLPKRCFELSQTNVVSTDIEIKKNTDLVRQQCQSIIEKCATDGVATSEIENDIRALTSVIMRENSVQLDPVINEIQELKYDDLLKKRKEFHEKLIEKYQSKELPITFDVFDVYIVFPKLVSYGASSDQVILGKDNKDLFAIDDFVKLDDWAASFNSNKWRGYIFISEKIDCTIAFEVAQEFVLQGKAEIKNPSAYIRNLAD